MTKFDRLAGTKAQLQQQQHLPEIYELQCHAARSGDAT